MKPNDIPPEDLKKTVESDSERLNESGKEKENGAPPSQMTENKRQSTTGAQVSERKESERNKSTGENDEILKNLILLK